MSTIPKKDLRRETLTAGGHGGQKNQHTQSAVRYTHLPTGIQVCCRSERSQYANDRAAYAILCAKLMRLIEESRRAAADDVYAAKPEPSFGSQVRTYRDVGERNVVDHRTGQAGTFDRVVRKGDIGPFLEATLRARAAGAEI